VYRLQGEALRTSDPAARTDVFAGHLCVFLKYGLTLDEDPDRDYTWNSDANGDGRFNHDVYELRGVFYLAERNLRAENMQLSFYDRNSLMPASSARRLGRYAVDFGAGSVRFALREPFRPLLSAAAAAAVYSAAPDTAVYNQSRFSFRADYFRDARDYRLQHTNIIPGSVRVRVNGRDVPSSLYAVDHASGVLRFADANTPLIGESTPVEVRYEYMPFAGTSQVFISGGRLDYRLNQSVAVGGTVLYSRDSAQKVVPSPGSEPTENLVLEADTSLNAGPSKLGRMFRR
jgi:hypothetical protein